MTETRPLFVLWDVDDVLIEDSGVSADIYALACEILTGRQPEAKPRAGGRTDPEIMAELLAENGFGDDERRFQKLLVPTLVAAMQRNAEALRERGRTAPGAVEALKATKSDPTVVQSVLSGNIAHNALAKLAAFGLDNYLDLEIGGFGADNPVRARLVSVARNRAKKKYSLHFDRSSTLVIGNTRLAVAAAIQGAARVLGVATGPDTEAELRDTGADAVLPDLQDTDAFLAALQVLRQP